MSDKYSCKFHNITDNDKPSRQFRTKLRELTEENKSECFRSFNILCHWDFFFKYLEICYFQFIISCFCYTDFEICYLCL